MNFTNVRVAVTGSSGFVGVPLVRRLRELGADVLEINRTRGYDIRTFDSLKNIGAFDALIHLAAKTFVPDSYETPRDFYLTNVVGTLNALELCRLRNARMIFASSYVYGTPRHVPIDESHPVASFNPYSGSKIIGEQLCERYHSDYGVKVAILRLFNIYGPNQNPKFLIPTIIDQARSGQVILKDPRPKRDFVYLSDAIEAYLQTLSYQEKSAEVFNIAGGKSFSVKEVVDEVLKNFEGEVQVAYTGEERACEVPDTLADIRKAQNLLGWEPRCPFAEGIRKCVAAKINAQEQSQGCP